MPLRMLETLPQQIEKSGENITLIKLDSDYKVDTFIIKSHNNSLDSPCSQYIKYDA